MTLYRETLCDHGLLTRHYMLGWGGTGTCLGGSREEVSIDLEAAARLHVEAVDGGFDALSSVNQQGVKRYMASLVDAALGKQ